jgi:sugar phosphate isomerase/epimerase
VKKEQLVINTLVFLEDLEAGIPQSEMMDMVHQLGINNVEIRREYIKDFNNELIEIRLKSTTYEMTVYYSVPEQMYKENTLRINDIETYCKEAYKMNAGHIKLNIGEVKEVSMQDMELINALCEKYHIQITVENDQTVENGRFEKIYHFLRQVKQQNGMITFTFDIGNWAFQGEDPFENAKLLNPFVTYIHLKDIDENRSTTLLNKGLIDWKNIISILPTNVPIALEYPCATEEQLALEINKLIDC